MTILIAASELDLSDQGCLDKLKPLEAVLDRCWMIPVHASSLALDVCIFTFGFERKVLHFFAKFLVHVLFNMCAKMTFKMGAIDRSFRNISLSFRGSERQPPSSLQLALRFSHVLQQREQEGRHRPDQPVEQRLAEIVSEFNSMAGLPNKHKIEDDRFKAVLHLLSGTCEVARTNFVHVCVCLFFFCFSFVFEICCT